MTPDIPGQERVFFQRAWWGRKEQEPPEFPPTWDQLTAGDSILAPQPPLAQVKPGADLREGSVTPSSSTRAGWWKTWQTEWPCSHAGLWAGTVRETQSAVFTLLLS